MSTSDAAPEERDHPSLGQAIAMSVLWKFSGGIGVQILRAVVLLALARILTPEDFGLAGMVLVFALLVPVFSDLGLGNALVYFENIAETDRTTVFWCCLGMGAAFTAAAALASWPVASFFGEPSVQPMLVVFAGSFLIMSLSVVPVAVMTRAMRFRELQLAGLASETVASAAALCLALTGFGAWALVGQYLVGASSGLCLLWLMCRWRPSRRFRRASLRRLAPYGVSIFGATLVEQLAQFLRNLLVGRLLGAQALGTLVLAQSIVLLPANRVAAPIEEVLFPAFSRLQRERERVVRIWRHGTRLIALLTIPALAGLALVANDFTAVVLGEQWIGAGPVISALALVGILEAQQLLLRGVLQARGRAGWLLGLSAVTVVAASSAVVLGAQWGLPEVALGLALAAGVGYVLSALAAARSVGVGVWHTVTPLGRTVGATVVMCGAVAVAHAALMQTDATATARLVTEVVVGATVAGPLLLALERNTLREAISALRGRPAFEPDPSLRGG